MCGKNELLNDKAGDVRWQVCFKPSDYPKHAFVVLFESINTGKMSAGLVTQDWVDVGT
jgi:hypothetical protein